MKFSPPIGTAVGQRWSDLLIAEHHAHELLHTADIPASRSRIFRFADRTYLEVTRFDRDGLEGRIGVTSLLSIDTKFYGALDNWSDAAVRLYRDRCIDLTTLERIQFVSVFGELIANTDRHFGNLAFYDTYNGRFELAPVYDMLPMLFAPVHDQLLARGYQPPVPKSDTLRVWSRARAYAEKYWHKLSDDGRLSADFRAMSAGCLSVLTALPRTGAYSYDADAEL